MHTLHCFERCLPDSACRVSLLLIRVRLNCFTSAFGALVQHAWYVVLTAAAAVHVYCSVLQAAGKKRAREESSEDEDENDSEDDDSEDAAGSSSDADYDMAADSSEDSDQPLPGEPYSVISAGLVTG
jgi:hypothetical protein